MAVLVTGSLMAACWPALGARLAASEARGLPAVVEVWAFAAGAAALGQVARLAARTAAGRELLERLLPAPSALEARAAREAAVLLLPHKEGREQSAYYNHHHYHHHGIGGGSGAVSSSSGGGGGTASSASGSACAAAAGGCSFSSVTGGAHAEAADAAQFAAAGGAVDGGNAVDGGGDDDVGAQKRRAQAEAAAQLAAYQYALQQQLQRIDEGAQQPEAAHAHGGRDGDDDGDDEHHARALFRLADGLFGSPANVVELVRQGGVGVLLRAAGAAARALGGARRGGDDAPHAALLQASWALLQVAHGPPAALAELAAPARAGELVGALRAALDSVADASPPAGGGGAAACSCGAVRGAALRNLAWTLLLLLDPTARGHVGGGAGPAPAAAACAAAVHAAGGGAVLARLLQCAGGAAPAWVAAAALGLLAGGDGNQQQQPEQQSEQQQRIADAALDALLEPGSLHALCHLLHARPHAAEPLGGRVAWLAGEAAPRALLARRAPALLQGLVEEQLVGPLAAALPRRLGRVLVCRLLSSEGQRVLRAVEEGYELDVPVALAQVAALPAALHTRLPTAAAAAAAQQQRCEIEPAADGDQQQQQQQQLQQQQQQGAASLEDTHTDVLAVRLLLQHERLDELLAGFCEDLLAGSSGGGDNDEGDDGAAEQQPAPPPPPSPAVAAVLALAAQLMARDLELQPPRHARGDSVADDSASAASSGGSSGSSAALDAALAAPDASGAYRRLMAGLVADEALPPLAAAATTSSSSSSADGGNGDDDLTLPPLPAGAAAAMAPCPPAGDGAVAFSFGGGLSHALSADTYAALKRASKLLHSVLSRAARPARGGQPQRPVALLATPHFTPAANRWVLRCLERWLQAGSLAGFTPRQAAKLWVAADFWQVDGLQAACEDALAAAFAAAAAVGEEEEEQGLGADAALDAALELAARHGPSAARLQRLAAQAALRGAAASAAAAGNRGDGEAAAATRLRALLRAHRAALLPGLRGELRDRLVAVCTLNLGVTDDGDDDDDSAGSCGGRAAAAACRSP